MNNFDVTFETAEPQRQQVPYTFTLCCEDFEPEKTHKTGLGWGEVDSAEIEPISETVTVILNQQ